MGTHCGLAHAPPRPHTRLHGHAVAQPGGSGAQPPAAASGLLCSHEVHGALPQRGRQQEAGAAPTGRAARQVAERGVRGRLLMRPGAVLCVSSAQIELGSQRRGRAGAAQRHHCSPWRRRPAMGCDQQVSAAVRGQRSGVLHPATNNAMLPKLAWRRRIHRAAGSRGDKPAAASGGGGVGSGVAGDLTIGGRHNHLRAASRANEAAARGLCRGQEEDHVQTLHDRPQRA